MAASELQSFVAPYYPAVIALLTLCLVVLIQNFLTALAFKEGEQSPGMPLSGDHALLSFRIVRTYQNSIESLPAFGLALIGAILAMAPVALVNGLAVIHVIFRLMFWLVYYTGVGKVAGGPRTLCYVGGLLTNIALAVSALYSLAG